MENNRKENKGQDGNSPDGNSQDGNSPDGNIYLSYSSEELSIFFGGTPKKGIYMDYLEKVSKLCIEELNRRRDPSNAPYQNVTLSFNNCLFLTSHPVSKRNTHIKRKSKIDGKIVEFYEPLSPMATVSREAKKMGYKIYVMTKSPPTSMFAILQNLKRANIPHDAVFTSCYQKEHPSFKSEIRGKFEYIDPNRLQNMNSFEIFSESFGKNAKKVSENVLNVGSSWYDVYKGSPDEFGVKLPSKTDFNSYIYSNDKVVSIVE